MKKNGFTLIELLVVIAIISLLVSILLPSLTKAKELARTVVCLSNQRNCGTAIHMYAYENDEWLMCADATGGVPNTQPGRRLGRYWDLDLLVNGYLPDSEIYQWNFDTRNPRVVWAVQYRSTNVLAICPSLDESQVLVDNNRKYRSDSWSYGIRHAGRIFAGEQFYGSEKVPGLAWTRPNAFKLDSIDPRLPYLGDTWTDNTSSAWTAMQWRPEPQQFALHRRHLDKANVWSIDNAAQSLTEQDLLNLVPDEDCFSSVGE